MTPNESSWMLLLWNMSLTCPPGSTGSSFSFFSIIGVGDVGRLLFATIGSWSGGIGSVGKCAAKFGKWLDRFAVEVKAEVDAAVVEEEPEVEVKTTFR